MRCALWLVVVLLVAGCTGPAANDDGSNGPPDQHLRQELTWQVARWNQTGLFEQLPNASVVDGLRVTGGQLFEGIPQANGSAVTAWEPARLMAVERTLTAFEDGGIAGERFSLDHRLVVQGLLAVERSNEEVREHFTAFAANVTGANATTVAAWADAFVASGNRSRTFESGSSIGPLVRFRTELDQPLNLTGLLASLEGRPSEEQQGGITARVLTIDDWRFTLHVPAKNVAGRVDDTLVQMTVTLADEIALLVTSEAGLEEEALRAIAATLLEQLGAGPLEADDWDVRTLEV